MQARFDLLSFVVQKCKGEFTSILRKLLVNYNKLVVGMSQSELAAKSGTSLRILQAYEQGVKDIRKTQVETVRKLAESMECEMDDSI